MTKKIVAIIGANSDIVALLVRLINQYDTFEAVSYEQTEDLFNSKFDLVLLSSGISEADEDLIRAQVSQPIIQHFGGGSGLLRAELMPYID